MRASACLVAEARPDGTTRLTTLADQAPLLLRQTSSPSSPTDGDRRAAHVHLVGGAAGPLGGDELHLSLHLGPRSEVRMGSVAASLALPGPDGAESTLDINVRIEAGASLTWHPQPLIAARGADHRTTVRIEMADDARLTWHEQTLLGRHGEAPGSCVTRLRVRLGERPLLDHTLAVGPRHRGSLGPAVVGRNRAGATILIVDPNRPEVSVTARDDAHGTIAALPLAAPAVLISALAPDGLTLRRLLDGLELPG